MTTAASETEGVAAVSWIESLMIRRPLGSIDPNSIHETEHVLCTWYQRALRCQWRGRPFHPWAGRLRFSGEAHPGPATLTQSSSFSCGAYTAPSLTGRGMLLVRGLPLRVEGRPMRHGRHTRTATYVRQLKPWPATAGAQTAILRLLA